MKHPLSILVSAAASVLVAGACRAPSTDTAEAVVECPSCRITTYEYVDHSYPYGSKLVTAEAMTCPDCHGPLATFFREGRLVHSCDACAGSVHCDH